MNPLPTKSLKKTCKESRKGKRKDSDGAKPETKKAEAHELETQGNEQVKPDHDSPRGDSQQPEKPSKGESANLILRKKIIVPGNKGKGTSGKGRERGEEGQEAAST